MSHHPARRARTVTAVLSAAAFAGIAGGLAATHASASDSHRVTTATTPATTPATDPGSAPDLGPNQGRPPTTAAGRPLRRRQARSERLSRATTGNPVPADIRFQAMAPPARIVVGEPHGLAERLRDRVVDLEARWSRFLDTSEISRLNRAAGAPVAVSPDTLELLAHAMEGWEATYGLFDPTILGDLERAGYDRTFERVGGRDPDEDELTRHPAAARTWTVPTRPVEGGSGPTRCSWLVRGCGDLEVDHQAGTARLPAGVGFDPGGIGKGFAADLVAAEAMAAGAAGVLIDLGGDVRVTGEPPERTGHWHIGVDHPLGALDLASVEMADGAVATSTRTKRRWTTADGEHRHHLIDPLLGSPVDSDVLRPLRWRPSDGRPRCWPRPPSSAGPCRAWACSHPGGSGGRVHGRRRAVRGT